MNRVASAIHRELRLPSGRVAHYWVAIGAEEAIVESEGREDDDDQSGGHGTSRRVASPRGAGALLLIVLHFQTDSDTRGAGRTALESLFVPAFGAWPRRVILVAPDAVVGGRPWAESLNEECVMAVREDALARFLVGEGGRVVLAGFSLGGGGCWDLCAKHPSKFDAIVPVAAVSPCSRVDAALWEVPVFAVHSDSDTVVRIAKAKTLMESLRNESSAPTHFLILHEVSHFNLRDYVDAVAKAVPWLLESFAQGSLFH